MKFRIRPRTIPFPAVRLIYPRLPMIGWHIPFVTTPTIAKHPLISGLLAIIIGAGLTGIGMYFSIHGVNQVPVWPDSAVYDASLSQDLGNASIRVGKPHKTATQTLQLNIAGARIDTIRFENLSIGKASGLTNSILVTGDLNVTGDLVAYLRCETVSFDGLVAPLFTLSETQVYDLVVASTTADGASLSPTLSSTPVDITVGSTRGALNVPRVKDSTYDRIIIDVGASDATCKTLEFVNVQAFGAGVSVGAVKAGTFTMTNSYIGTGDGINTPDLIIADTVLVQVADLVGVVDDRPISVE